MFTRNQRKYLREYLVYNKIVRPKLLHNKGNNCSVLYGMQRSGNHVFINWLAFGLGNIMHLNECNIYGTFGLRFDPSQIKYYDYDIGLNKSRSVVYNRRDENINRMIYNSKNVLYTFENAYPYSNIKSLLNAEQQYIIIRDPANWLASFMKRYHDFYGEERLHFLSKNVEMYKMLLQFCVNLKYKSSENFVIIDFTQFSSNSLYRKSLSLLIDKHDFSNAEESLNIIPENGGGSSFTKFDSNPNVNGRWDYYSNSSTFLQLLDDKELTRLAKDIFIELPGYTELGLT